MKKWKMIKQKLKNNKPLYISYNIIKTILTIFLLIALVVVLIQKFFNNKSILGYRIYSVASESMKDYYSIGDIIIIKETDADKLKIGDDVTYINNNGAYEGMMITHRIISIRNEGDNYYYVTKGTSNEIADNEISYSQIYGKVVYKTIVFSYIGRLMSNVYSYYALFTVVGLYVSYQFVKSKFDDEDLEDEKEKDSNNS